VARSFAHFVHKAAARSWREYVSTNGQSYMSTEPEETDAKRLEREHEVERVPEGTFGGTRERLREVEGDKPEPDDTGDQGHGQN
jgi:hypothetical protein